MKGNRFVSIADIELTTIYSKKRISISYIRNTFEELVERSVFQLRKLIFTKFQKKKLINCLLLFLIHSAGIFRTHTILRIINIYTCIIRIFLYRPIEIYIHIWILKVKSIKSILFI